MNALVSSLQPIDIPEILEYGAFGALMLVLIGVYLIFRSYVQSTETRAAKREEIEQERQAQWMTMLLEETRTLATLTKELETHGEGLKAHDKRMQETHVKILEACQQFSNRGIGE